MKAKSRRRNLPIPLALRGVLAKMKEREQFTGPEGPSLRRPNWQACGRAQRRPATTEANRPLARHAVAVLALLPKDPHDAGERARDGFHGPNGDGGA